MVVTLRKTTFAMENRVIKLVQITDSHLGQKVGEDLLGMDVDVSLQHVIDLLKQERAGADLLLATGDLSNCGSVPAYQRFASMTAGLAEQVLWLPGNHDDLAAMEQAFTQGEPLPRTLQIGGWKIIMLDSRIPGAVGGRLSGSELSLLERELSQSPGQHVLVCLHHHPVDIDCAWLDQQRVSNADEFFALLDRFDHVRGVLWGHIHQQIDRVRNGVQLMATPSSCIQFAPEQVSFKLDTLNPGYRWLDLHPDGSIKTGVSRISQHFGIDYDYTGGYE